MTVGNLAHHVHQQRILVYRKVSFFKNRSKLKLVRCYLIMACFQRNTKQQALVFQIAHIAKYALRYRTEVVVVQLLPFSCLMPQKSTPCNHQVGTRVSKGFIYQKVFLFPAKRSGYLVYIFIKIARHLSSGCIYSRKCL